jgi:hypothetical protein
VCIRPVEGRPNWPVLAVGADYADRAGASSDAVSSGSRNL